MKGIIYFLLIAIVAGTAAWFSAPTMRCKAKPVAKIDGTAAEWKASAYECVGVLNTQIERLLICQKVATNLATRIEKEWRCEFQDGFVTCEMLDKNGKSHIKRFKECKEW